MVSFPYHSHFRDSNMGKGSHVLEGSLKIPLILVREKWEVKYPTWSIPAPSNGCQTFWHPLEGPDLVFVTPFCGGH